MALSANLSRGYSSWTDEFLDITHFQSTDNSRIEDSRLVRSLQRNLSSSESPIERQSVKPSHPLFSPPCSTHSGTDADRLKNLLRSSTAVSKNRNKNNGREGEAKKSSEKDDKRNSGGKKVADALQRIWSAGKLLAKKGKYKKNTNQTQRTQQVFVREYDATSTSVVKFNQCQQRAKKQPQKINNRNLQHLSVVHSSSLSDAGTIHPSGDHFTDILSSVGSCGTTIDSCCQSMFPTPTTMSYNQ